MHVIARALVGWRGKRTGTTLSPCNGRPPEQQLGSRSLVFKSIKGDCYGDTAAARVSGSTRHPIWPPPSTHLLSSRPSKFGVCLEFMNTFNSVFNSCLQEISGSGVLLCLRKCISITQLIPAGMQLSQDSMHTLSSTWSQPSKLTQS